MSLLIATSHVEVAWLRYWRRHLMNAGVQQIVRERPKGWLGSNWGISPFLHMWRLQDGRCFYCDAEMRPTQYRANNMLGWTKDHLVPLSRGGSDQPSNIVLSCRNCNQNKGDRKPSRRERTKAAALWGEAEHFFVHGGSK